MSSFISIGDILLIVNGTLNLFGRLKNAPADLAVAERDVEQMHTSLEVLNTKLSDKTSSLAKHHKISLIIQNELKPLREDLVDMDDILRDYVECKSVTLMGRVRYAILDKNKLQDLRARFSRFTNTFQHMLILLNTEAHDVQIRNDGISHAKLDAIIHEQKKGAQDRLVDAQENKKSRQKLEKVLKILEERPIAQANSVTVQDPNQVLEQLETELKKIGYSSDKAKAARDRATQELSGKSRPSLIGIPPIGSNLGPQEIRPIQIPAAEECRILCVDRTHGIRSVLAQTYLEIMRVFTATRSPYSGRWLFKRVESAGFEISPDRGMAVIQKGISKLVSPYEQSPAAVDEVSQVGVILKGYGNFAFTKSDLMTYHYVLSFRPYIDLLKKMRDDLQKQNPNVPLSEIVMLEGCHHISTTDCMQDEGNIDKLIASIKGAVKRFVRQPPFNWSPSIYTNEKNHRILHFATNKACLKYLIPGAGETFQGGQKLKEIENKTKCSVKVTRRLPVQDGSVIVSIIGPQERLNKALSLTVADPTLTTGNHLPFAVPT